MRFLTSAAILAGFAVLCGSAAFAADLDYPYHPRLPRAHLPPYPPPVAYDYVVPNAYSHPVVGFYGYPYAYVAPVLTTIRPLPKVAGQPYPTDRIYAPPNGYELN